MNPKITAIILCATVLAATPAHPADDVLDAIEQARKAYQSGDLVNAKQSLDLASQLIGQKNAEASSAALPGPLAGWKAEKAQTTAVGSVGFGASQASRTYSNAKGQNVEIQITGDSAMVGQFAAMLANPQIAGAMGKIIRVGNQRAIQHPDGDVHMVVANKVMIVVSGSADAAAKLSYAQAIDVAKLPKM
jgi:NAD-dependent DNA ligase